MAVKVAPHAGAWIEIKQVLENYFNNGSSHLTQVRGLKFDINIHFYEPPEVVAPHAGAWIEIFKSFLGWPSILVAPHAGAWIEINNKEQKSNKTRVAPRTGA